MIDLSFSEMLLVAVVAIVVIGPKDLPRVMSQVGKWVGQGKAMVRQFRHSIDDMVREAELQDMEKRWAERNQRIMAEHPDAPDTPNGSDVEGAGADAGAGAGAEMKPLAPPAPSSPPAPSPAPEPTHADAPELPLDVPASDPGKDAPK